MAKSEYYVDPLNGSDTTGDGLSDATAWQSVQHALDNITKNTTDGDRINIKDTADDVLSATLDFTTIGSYAYTYSLVFQGYTSTAGDGGIGGISGGGGNFSISGGSYKNWKDMRLHNTGTATILTTARSSVENCTFENGSNGVSHNIGSILGCRFYDLTGAGVVTYRSIVAQNHFENGTTNKMTSGVNVTSTTCSVVNNTFSIDGSTTAIRSNSDPIQIFGNSILSNGGTGDGIYLGKDTYGSIIANNLVEGFSGAGGAGISRQINGSTRDASLINNSVYNCTTEYEGAFDYAALNEGNESLGDSPFSKSGADTFENRRIYFAPADVGSVIGGGIGGTDRGAIPAASGGGGTTISPKHPLARF